MEQVLPALQQAGGAQGIEVAVATEALVESKKTVVGRLIDFFRDVKVGHEKIGGLPWTEIDFPEDVTKAEREIPVFIATRR